MSVFGRKILYNPFVILSTVSTLIGSSWLNEPFSKFLFEEKRAQIATQGRIHPDGIRCNLTIKFKAYSSNWLKGNVTMNAQQNQSAAP